MSSSFFLNPNLYSRQGTLEEDKKERRAGIEGEKKKRLKLKIGKVTRGLEKRGKGEERKGRKGGKENEES